MAEIDLLKQIDEKLDKIQTDVTTIKVADARQCEQIERNTKDIAKMEGRQWTFFGGNTLLAAVAAILGLTS